ncbi:Transcription factor bHLH145 [Vitis vinifera]|uniref:Transcription factor bHLH145 n=1 Tax=Vitis vinifera TaxID=29760 RepID=A0A438FZJ0_VITVI|nr:Transcription factor bHLH145 [Vitis vinifera]
MIQQPTGHAPTELIFHASSLYTNILRALRTFDFDYCPLSSCLSLSTAFFSVVFRLIEFWPSRIRAISLLLTQLPLSFFSPLHYSGSAVDFHLGSAVDSVVVLLLKGRDVVMVCQAASQTRFRALKHENGIAGSATIIVRVIACFQPLQDCQDCGSWLPHQHPGWLSPDLNTLSAPLGLELEQQNIISAYMNPCPNLAFTHASNSILKEKLPAGPYGNSRVVNAPNVISECAQKRFLVFDQSGDQTTLVFSSVIGTPGQCLTSWSPKPSGAHNLSGGEEGTKRDLIYHQGPILTDESNENGGTDVQSEMHEDTEELNALLYSDDEYSYSEDDEETSTGHSPSTMTVYDRQEWLEGEAEEVASSDGSNKRRKLFNGDFNVPSLMDTASSAKPDNSLEYEDDAESSCADGNNPEPGEIQSFSGNKRSRKDRIRETVNILQSLIPGGKGKDAIVVLDEAIHYLKSLKLKAKALGLDTP